MPNRALHEDAVLALFYRKEFDGDQSDWYFKPLFEELCPPYSEAFVRNAVKNLIERQALGTSTEINFEHEIKSWREIWKWLLPSGAQASFFITQSGMDEVEQILYQRDENIHEYVNWLKQQS